MRVQGGWGGSQTRTSTSTRGPAGLEVKTAVPGEGGVTKEPAEETSDGHLCVRSP